MACSIAIGSDHAGYELKATIIGRLLAGDYIIDNVGTYDTDPVDYPDVADRLTQAVLAGNCRGILICGSGIGACVAANKIPRIRAGLAHDTYSAHQGVEHDDMNVLVLGARVIGPELAMELVTAFLSAEFSPVDRYLRRLEKVRHLEDVYAGGGTQHA